MGGNMTHLLDTSIIVVVVVVVVVVVIVVVIIVVVVVLFGYMSKSHTNFILYDNTENTIKT